MFGWSYNLPAELGKVADVQIVVKVKVKFVLLGKAISRRESFLHFEWRLQNVYKLAHLQRVHYLLTVLAHAHEARVHIVESTHKILMNLKVRREV